MSGLSNNIFAALQKKKSSKKPIAKEIVEEEPQVDKHAELEKAIFSGTGTGLGNWADESEDEWDAHANHPAAAEEGWNQVRLLPLIDCVKHISIPRISPISRDFPLILQATKGLSTSRSQARIVELQGDHDTDDEDSDEDDIHVSTIALGVVWTMRVVRYTDTFYFFHKK